MPSLQGSSPGQAIRATSPAVPQALLYFCVESRSRLLASIGSSLAWESREEKHTIVVPCLAARERASSFHPQCFLNLSSAAPKEIFYQKLKVGLPEDSLGLMHTHTPAQVSVEPRKTFPKTWIKTGEMGLERWLRG